MCTININQCLETLSICGDYFQKEYGIEDKYYLWSKYHFSYFSMIYNKNPELLEQVVTYHNKLKKNFYLNYRQRINGLASYFYYIGNMTNGNKYLLLEASFENELPMRQMAFHYETVALHEVLVNNFKDAKQALHQVINMFNELPSYQKIATHNLNLLQKTSTVPNIKYWFGENLSPKIYYIDSRCSW